MYEPEIGEVYMASSNFGDEVLAVRTCVDYPHSSGEKKTLSCLNLGDYVKIGDFTSFKTLDQGVLNLHKGEIKYLIELLQTLEEDTALMCVTNPLKRVQEGGG